MTSCDFVLSRLGNALWPLSGCIRWCEGPYRFHTLTQCQNILKKTSQKTTCCLGSISLLKEARKGAKSDPSTCGWFRGGPLRTTVCPSLHTTGLHMKILVTMVTIILITYRMFTSLTKQQLVLLFAHNWVRIDLVSVTLLHKSDPPVHFCSTLKLGFIHRPLFDISGKGRCGTGIWNNVSRKTETWHSWFGSRPNASLVLKHLLLVRGRDAT